MVILGFYVYVCVFIFLGVPIIQARLRYWIWLVKYASSLYVIYKCGLENGSLVKLFITSH